MTKESSSDLKRALIGEMQEIFDQTFSMKAEVEWKAGTLRKKVRLNNSIFFSA
jgi:hypothetical protein